MILGVDFNACGISFIACLKWSLVSSATVLDSKTSSLTVNNGQAFEFSGQTGVTGVNESLPATAGSEVRVETPLTEVHATPLP
jgi:hypothetical protein